LSLWRSPAKLLAGVAIRGRLLGTTYAADAYPLRVTRGDSSLHVKYRRGAQTGDIECDYLACGFNLIPNNELPRLLGCEVTGDGFVRVDRRLQTTEPNVYAIGELTGIGGVDKALLEGRIAAHAIAGDETAAHALASSHARAMAFVERLDAAFSLRPELLQLAEASTIVCRCEDVTLAAVKNAFSGRDAKLQTRCGMGVCQGRVCGPVLQRLIGAESPQVRPPVFTTRIATLARAPAMASRGDA
ncbi:MAG: FAD-dependent oxidoreductase, partial [Tepidisphaeraceae bacterium]